MQFLKLAFLTCSATGGFDNSAGCQFVWHWAVPLLAEGSGDQREPVPGAVVQPAHQP